MLNLPKTTKKSIQQDWSDCEMAGGNSDWSEAEWSEAETSDKKSKKSYKFSTVYQKPRVGMTPRSQALSQILDDLYTMTSN